MNGVTPKAWWHERKELSLARKAAMPSRETCAKPGDAFLIVNRRDGFARAVQRPLGHGPGRAGGRGIAVRDRTTGTPSTTSR
jgi:hypothetical protein